MRTQRNSSAPFGCKITCSFLVSASVGGLARDGSHRLTWGWIRGKSADGTSATLKLPGSICVFEPSFNNDARGAHGGAE